MNLQRQQQPCHRLPFRYVLKFLPVPHNLFTSTTLEIIAIKPPTQSQSSGESQSSGALQAGKLKPKIEIVRIHHLPTKEPRTPTAPNSRRPPPRRATPITPITPSNADRRTSRTVYEVKDSPEPQPMEILTIKNPSKRMMNYNTDDSEDDTDPQRINKQKRRKVSKAGPSHTRKNCSLQNEDVTRAICEDASESEEYDEIAIRPGVG